MVSIKRPFSLSDDERWAFSLVVPARIDTASIADVLRAIAIHTEVRDFEAAQSVTRRAMVALLDGVADGQTEASVVSAFLTRARALGAIR